MDIDISELVAEFLNENPVFFNEADMVNQFARFVIYKYNDTDVYMEVAAHIPTILAGIPVDKSVSLDLVLLIGERVIVFEMKYKTSQFDHPIGKIHYHLKNQGSQNLSRYDVWYDLERCEYVLNQNIPSIDKTPSEAYVLLYTNDSSLWGTAAKTMSDNLKLEAGNYMGAERRLHAPNNPDGMPSEGSIGKFRRGHPIRIANNYDFVWKETRHGFRFLLIKAQPDLEDIR